MVDVVQQEIFKFVFVHQRIMTKFVIEPIPILSSYLLSCYHLQKSCKSITGEGFAGFGQKHEQSCHCLSDLLIARHLHLFECLGGLYPFHFSWEGYCSSSQPLNLNQVVVDVHRDYNFYLIPIFFLEKVQDRVAVVLLVLFPPLLSLLLAASVQHGQLQ